MGFNNIEINQTLNSRHEVMRKRSHFEHFRFCHFGNAVVIGFYTQLYHSGKESAVLLVQLTCEDKMPAKFSQRTIVRLGCYSTSDKRSMHYVVAGIIEAIGRQTPSLLLNHVIGFLQEAMGLFLLKCDQEYGIHRRYNRLMPSRCTLS